MTSFLKVWSAKGQYATGGSGAVGKYIINDRKIQIKTDFFYIYIFGNIFANALLRCYNTK